MTDVLTNSKGTSYKVAVAGCNSSNRHKTVATDRWMRGIEIDRSGSCCVRVAGGGRRRCEEGVRNECHHVA